MTLTGVRGLIAITVVTLPLLVVILALPGPAGFRSRPDVGRRARAGRAAGAALQHPGLNPIVALAGMSIIWPLGDAIPPTAIIGRLTVDVVGFRGSYGRFLRACLVPAVLIVVVGTLMVFYQQEAGLLDGLCRSVV